MTQKILLIEDEAGIADTVIYALKTENYEPVWCSTGLEGEQALKQTDFSLIIIDVGLPDISGFELCKKIRVTSAVPVIFLTARNDEIDRVVGLEIGADDYMSKPFSPRELNARIRAVLRRYTVTTADKKVTAVLKKSEPFDIDPGTMRISYFGSKLDLSCYEYKILKLLIDHPLRVFSREELMNAAWEEPGFSLERTIDTHIKSIRGKFRAIKPDLDPIETRRGFGYALKEIVE
jgi:two-component system catabolic regulation response regulator CreB